MTTFQDLPGGLDEFWGHHLSNDFADLIDDNGYVDDRLTDILYPSLRSMAERLVSSIQGHAVGKTMLTALLDELQEREYGSAHVATHSQLHCLHDDLHDEEGTTVVPHEETTDGVHLAVHQLHERLTERHGDL